MLRAVLFGSCLAIGLAGLPAASWAEAISTTSCKAAADRTKTQGGKSYKCTGCEACTTTTCQTGGPASCTNTTTTTCSCEEVASGPKQHLQPGGGITAQPGVFDPGRPTRKGAGVEGIRPQKLQKLQQ